MNEETKTELENLHHEFFSDINITEANLYDVSLKAPGIKAKWIRQVWVYDFEYKQLQRTLSSLSEKHDKIVRGKLKVDATPEQISKLRLKTDKELEAVRDRLEELCFIIDHLKQYLKMVTYFAQDVSNALKATAMDH